MLLLIRAYRFFVRTDWIFTLFALYYENFSFIISGKLVYTHVLLYALKMSKIPTFRAINQFIVHSLIVIIFILGAKLIKNFHLSKSNVVICRQKLSNRNSFLVLDNHIVYQISLILFCRW